MFCHMQYVHVQHAEFIGANVALGAIRADYQYVGRDGFTAYNIHFFSATICHIRRAKFIISILGSTPITKSLYSAANRNVERVSKIGAIFLYVIMVPFYIIPAIIQSYFTYFTTDLGELSFQLPFLQT